MPNLNSTYVDENQPTPLYHQIFLVLKRQIVSGEFKSRDTLPSEQELARLFNVSRVTIKRALDELARLGLVSRHRGRGTVVHFSRPAPIVKGSFDGLMESLKEIGAKTSIQLLEFGERPASSDVASALEVEPGTPLQYAVRVRSMNGQPMSHLVTHVPLDIGASITRARLKTSPILALIEQSGAKISSAHQTLTAVAASPALSEALDISIGEPLLQVMRTIHDENGRPVQYIVAHYRPDLYQYDMALTRTSDGNKSFWKTQNH